MNKTMEPQPIEFKEHIFDFSFHPVQNIVVAGLINGQVQCWKYAADSRNTLGWSTQVSKKSCRGVEFTPDGAHLLSISRDKSIQALDVATGRLLYKLPKAHKYAINKICKLDSHLTATGDDEGIIKLWDMRTCKATQEYKVHEDFIAEMEYCQDRSALLATGGDGLLSIFDTRKSTDKIKVSEALDDELLSMAVVEDGNKIIAGSQSGALYTWDWNRWDTNRKWLGHPNSVDAICKLDEQFICTGGSDGLLRLISVQPYKFEGILGDHGQDFPVESIRLDHHQSYLASCGHDLQLKFWNVQFLFEQEQQDSSTMKRKVIQIDDDDEDNDTKRHDTKRTRESFFHELS